MPESPKIKRKDFLACCGSTILGLGLGVSCGRTQNVQETQAAGLPAIASQTAADKSVTPVFRTLGKAGIEVTEVGFGASRTMDPTLMNHAIEKGINFFDTGRSYYNGQNEYLLGKVLKGKRQQVVINSKLPPASLEKMRKDLETSLSALATDYIDCLLIHGASKPEQIYGEDTIELFTRAKEEGKIRTFGFSSHSNFIELIELAAGRGFHEVVLVPYNFLGSYVHMLGGNRGQWDSQALEKAIKKGGESGIDFISMKGCSGGFMKDSEGRETYQAALKWILRNPHLKTTATAMGNFQQIEENAGAMNSKGLGEADWRRLDRYAENHGENYSRMCGSCSGKCPNGVPVAEVNRLHMYASGYGGDMGREARRNYSALSGSGSAACLSCENCVVRCPYGLPLGSKLKKAHLLLS